MSAIDGESAAPIEQGAAVRVLLADDQQLLREGLRILLDLQPEITVVGDARDGNEAQHLVELLQPHVVLMDLRMPRCDGVSATRAITSRWPHVRVIVLTTFDEDELVFASLAAGAVGYLLKDVGAEALATAIVGVMRGESPLQPSIARKVIQRLRNEAASALPKAPAAMPLLPCAEALTPREMTVLRLLAQGASNQEIATGLSLNEGTVRNYISTILAKTGLRDRTQAALFAVRNGLSELCTEAGYQRIGRAPDHD